MQENNKALVLAQLEVLKTANAEIKPAFVGAMLMKRASFLGPAALRLHYFREGQKMLRWATVAWSRNAGSPPRAGRAAARLTGAVIAPSMIRWRVSWSCGMASSTSGGLAPDRIARRRTGRTAKCRSAFRLRCNRRRPRRRSPRSSAPRGPSVPRGRPR